MRRVNSGSFFTLHPLLFILHSSFLLLTSYFFIFHFPFSILLFIISFPVQACVPEVEHDIRQDHEKIDEIEDRRKVIGMRDDLAGNAENITDLDQA